MKGRMILASASPRRSQLLQGLGFDFVVRPAHCDEQSDIRDGAALVRELSRRKALSVQAGAEDAVIAADTVVCLDGAVLGKPADEEEAFSMLARLSGREHTVYTGVTVRRGGLLRTRSEETRVFFRPLTPEEIRRYIATGEPMDKAGAYGIQGRGGTFVRRIEGDYYNVVGLPLCALCEMLEEIGVDA